jgi:hypothetical protein
MMETTAPLEDPDYSPLHPPVDGNIPDVVAKWGPRSQLRWFDRYASQLKPQKISRWNEFYCSVEGHRGECCSSCLQDKLVYDYLPGVCCCLAEMNDE